MELTKVNLALSPSVLSFLAMSDYYLQLYFVYILGYFTIKKKNRVNAELLVIATWLGLGSGITGVHCIMKFVHSFLLRNIGIAIRPLALTLL